MNFKEEYLRILRERLTNYSHSNYKYYTPIEPLEQTDKGIICEEKTYDSLERFYGKDWPQHAVTMVGLVRLNILDELVEQIAKNNIAGDFFEAGVWRGGASIYLQALNHVYLNGERNVWLADSFEGLPPSTHEKDLKYDFTQFDILAVSQEEVVQNFKNFNLLADNVKFVKGWFKDTLPHVKVGKISLLRLDGDLYESTMDILNSLYHKVEPGGYIVVDDYCLDCCQEAIADFRKQHNITSPIVEIDWTGVYWRKDS